MQYLVHSVAVVVVVCVQSVLAKRGMSRVLPGMSVGKRQPSPSPRIYICMCSVPRVPKCGQLVVRNLFWLQSKFFFFLFCLLFIYELNRTENWVETKCCRLLLLLLLMLSCGGGGSCLLQRKRNISTRDVAVLFVSYSAVVILHSYRCCCSVDICCWKIPV